MDYASDLTSSGFSVRCDDGVYEFMIQQLTPAVLDDYFACLESIFDATSPDEIVPIMLYSSACMPEIQNMAARDAALRAKYERVPFVRLAIMHEDRAHFAVMNLMMRVVNANRHMAMRMFSVRDRSAALFWLRH